MSGRRLWPNRSPRRTSMKKRTRSNLLPMLEDCVYECFVLCIGAVDRVICDLLGCTWRQCLCDKCMDWSCGHY